MTIAQLRQRLTELIQTLPRADIADATTQVEAVHEQLTTAWRTSEHVSSQAALAASAAAIAQLGEISARLEAVAKDIDLYLARL